MRNSSRSQAGEVSRREFISSPVAASLLPHLSTNRTDLTSNLSGQPLAWIEEQPIVIVGNWDDIPLFRRRAGGRLVDQTEEHRQEHPEETVKSLRELGVAMAILHFYKAFGLVA